MKQVKFLMVALMLAMSSAANAQLTKEQYRAILEDFCISYYEDAFGGKQYIEGTLKVTSVEKNVSTGVYTVRGTHSYRGRYFPFKGRENHPDRKFKADISETRDGLKTIKFWKWRDADILNPIADFEGPCVKTIIP